MFFEKNKRMLIGTGVVALLWIILFYSLVSPNWAAADSKEKEAGSGKAAWENATKNDKDSKRAAANKNAYTKRTTAEEEIKESSEKLQAKFKEMRRIEFGTAASLKPFSTAAAGKGGDINELLNRTNKDEVKHARTILKNATISEQIFSEHFGEIGGVPTNLLRLALVNRFLNACKQVKDESGECKIDQIVSVDYGLPAVIEVPEDAKAEIEKDKDASDDEIDPGANAKKKRKKDKDAEKAESIDRLVQVPIKVLLRIPAENYINELLFELQKPTPPGQDGEDARGYFCVRGFHVVTRENLPSDIEACVGMAALIRESELKTMRVPVKDESKGPSRPEDIPF
ncbi:MAG TPA: hypothetical protein VKX17_14105 [Planctomycetota bacterium]|nr:hypothetical protein [Planctomycetota bacterium]